MNKIWKFTLQAADPEALSSLTVTVNGQELPETGVLAGPSILQRRFVVDSRFGIYQGNMGFAVIFGWEKC